MKKKLRQRIWLSMIALWAILIIACAVYVNDYYHADKTALEALVSSEHVKVTSLENMVTFVPEDPVAGFIFYPGGKVEYTAYAPLLHELAKENILCILVEMPFHLAVLDMNAADGIPAQYPEVNRWYIGGHSLGGSMAASHVSDNIPIYDGLVLLASYSTADISSTDLQVISIYGTEDQVLNSQKYTEYYRNLPSTTEEIVIEGGCHAYFGNYGAQDGDGIPAITAHEQIQITVKYLSQFFRKEQS